MKNIFFISIILSSTFLFSQTSFYVKPLLEAKSNINFESSTTKGNGYNWIQNEFFRINNHKMVQPSTMKFGVSAGVILKEKHFFELGIGKDVMNMKTSLDINLLMVDSASTVVQQNRSTSKFSTENTKMMLNYQMMFFSSNHIKGRVHAGINFIYNPRVQKGVKFETWESQGTLPQPVFHQNTVLVSDQPESFYSYRVRFASTVNLGIGFDFHSKKHYLFSLDVMYQQGFTKSLIGSHKVRVIDAGNLYDFVYYNESRSSGFIFQISRRFQLYPWGSKKQ